MSWKNINKISEMDRAFGAMPIDLYAGLSGMGIFYLELYLLSKEMKYFNVFEKILDEIVEECNYALPSYSAYIGKNSMYFLILNEIAKLGYSKYSSKLDELLKKAETLCCEKEKQEVDIDWLGLSSFIVLLIRYYEVMNNQHALELATQLMHIYIISEKTPINFGLGMGHGASGIRYTVSQLRKHIKNDEEINRFYQYYVQETSTHFDIEKENSFGWCKGYAGELIALSNSFDELKNSSFNSLVEQTLEVFHDTISSDDSLCHGNGSDIEALISIANRVEDNVAVKNILLEKVHTVVKKIDDFDFNIRKLPEIETCDLFTGIAGIGYELLRYLSPDSVSNVFTLDIL